MTVGPSVPREGGTTIVFTVAADDVERITAIVTGAGFAVRDYYRGDHRTGPGRPAPGRVRLGAERSMTEFTDQESARIVAAFDQVLADSGLSCVRDGTDVWTAGDRDDPAGVREPRRPRPRDLVGAGRPTSAASAGLSPTA